ncbi:MAG: SulP family inorganic anion transporter [Chlamydiae bacterium]|nr:SulP family inorganic anion transporter [Chlamydiota bacterium]
MPSFFKSYEPQLYTTLHQGYSLKTLRKDLLSGITVAVLSISLCMQLSISSGTSPLQGLYTGIIGGFIVSILGGCRVQINGPTAALIAVIYGMMQLYGYEALCLSTMIAGAFMMCLGFLKIGKWIKFIPNSLVIGFTSGLGITLFSDQIKNFMGFTTKTPLPDQFIFQVQYYFTNYNSINSTTFYVGISSIAMILVIKKYFPKISPGIITIFTVTVFCNFFSLPVDTIESKYGKLLSTLPSFNWPSFTLTWENLPSILKCSFNIAIIGSLESLLSSIIAKEINGQDFKPSIELFAQGMANLGTALFGGIPTTGVVLLTAANAKSGALTPIAGLLRATILLVIILLFSNVVSFIPLVSLSVVLMFVSFELIKLTLFIRYLKGPGLDVAVLVTSFLFTIFTNLSTSVFVGISVASVIFMRQMSKKSKAIDLKQFDTNTELNAKIKNKEFFSIYKMQGALFFGNADILTKIEKAEIYILDMSEVPFIDASGFCVIENFYTDCLKKQSKIYICGLQNNILKQMQKFGSLKVIPKQTFCTSINEAIMLES